MKKIYFILPLAMFLLTGCISINTGGAKKTNNNLGGVFKSVDKGEKWTNASVIATANGKQSNFSTLNVASMTIDPSDNKAVYFGSVDNGLLYTYDSALTWQLSKELGQGTVAAISVDPKDKCTIFASKNNKIYKSTDCNRSWKQVYQDNDQTMIINKINVDPYNSNIVYAIISRGDLIRSLDGGNAWQVVYRFGAKMTKIVVNAKNNQEIFAVTHQKGIFKTTDGGKNWSRMVEVDVALKDNDMKFDVRDFLVIDNDKGRSIYLATSYGLLKSTDNGITWSRIGLITPEAKATINAVAVNPGNTEEIYYVTDSTFYKSTDGGNTWKTVALPSSRAGKILMVDQKEPNTIYLGVVELKK